MKRITARFYRSENGHEPVRQWLMDLSSGDRKLVGKDIATVEFGWPIGMPVCKPLRNGLFEVRSTIKAGKVEARTYFAIEGDVMVLLHGAEGKGRQAQAISTALERLRNHRKRAATE